MPEDKPGKTIPKPRGVDSKTDPFLLTAGRYGTAEMANIFGRDKTYEFNLRAQAEAVRVLSFTYPDIVSVHDAVELVNKVPEVKPDRIAELEEKTGHDVIAINSAWGELVSKKAASHINKARTSADTTETARAMQLQQAIKIIADSTENLRDIVLEKAIEWIDVPHMDVTHLYDALPTVAGRPFAFYAEMLQSDLGFMRIVYDFSLVGKWADATGNHHSSTALGIDGIKLQKKYCKRLGLRCMTAPAQIVGREYTTDVLYALARTGETTGNLAHYVRWGRGDDTGIFRFPRKSKGSSAMPHKDAKGGNPTAEEQAESFANYMRGVLATSIASCRFDYARDLSGSASDRIILEDAFKFGDHTLRNMAGTVAKLEIVPERAKERVYRSFGAVTSQEVMNYLTDRRKTSNPMSRDEAHELTARLATQAYDGKRQFVDVLLESPEVTSRLSRELILEVADPARYIGQSKEIINDAYEQFHGKKTF